MITVHHLNNSRSQRVIWMLEELVRPRERPVTNVVAMLVMLVTMLPILGAYYLTRGGDSVAGGGK